MVFIEDLRVGKLMSSGAFGYVHEMLDENLNVDPGYVLKAEKLVIGTKNWMLENLFAYQMNENFSQKFIKLYDYKIIPNCEFNKQYPKLLGKSVQQMIKDAQESTHCIYRLYERIDNCLGSILDGDRIPFCSKVMYSVFIQMINIVWIMSGHGWSHNDFHAGNIGVVYEDTNIGIGDRYIYNYGYTIKAIDYGMVNNDLYEAKQYRDIASVANLCFKSDFFKTAKPTKNVLNKLKKAFRHIKEDNKFIFVTKCMLDNFKLYQKAFDPKQKQVYDMSFLIDIEDIKFILDNYTNLGIVKTHLVAKLEKLEAK